MSGQNLHHVKITSRDGLGIFTTVELDGQPVRFVTFVGLSINVDRRVEVTLRMEADVIFEGEAEIIQTWRNRLPWWRRVLALRVRS